jgi:hypothetical protein
MDDEKEPTCFSKDREAVSPLVFAVVDAVLKARAVEQWRDHVFLSRMGMTGTPALARRAEHRFGWWRSTWTG